MSGEGAFPFDPAHVAELGALSAKVNARSAPPPLSDPIVFDDFGRVLLPVPSHPDAQPDFVLSIMALLQQKAVWCELHAGMTLQWAPMIEAGGMLLAVRGGAPDGDEHRDGAAVFLTFDGLAALIRDLQSIAVSLAVAS